MARVSSYMTPGVRGEPFRSTSAIVPDVASTATPRTARAGTVCIASDDAAAIACHHSSGSCSCRAPDLRLVSGRVAAPTTSPLAVTAIARALCVPTSRPSQTSVARPATARRVLPLMIARARSRASPRSRLPSLRWRVESRTPAIAQAWAVQAVDYRPRKPVYLCDRHPAESGVDPLLSASAWVVLKVAARPPHRLGRSLIAYCFGARMRVQPARTQRSRPLEYTTKEATNG